MSIIKENTNWLTLGEALAVLRYKTGISFSQYRTLAEWLDCYSYILPEFRDLNESVLYIPPRNNSTISFMLLHEFMMMLEKHYTTSEQSHIIREIQCQLIQDF